MEAVKTIVRDTLSSSPFLERLYTFGNPLFPQQSPTAATYVLIMASLVLLFLFMAIVVILATSGSSRNFNSNKNNNKASSTDDSSTSSSSSGAHAFSTFVQTRLRQSKQQARSRQQALVRLLENSKLALRSSAQARDPSSNSNSNNWWEDLSPSAFRLLLPEEEDALFFDDDVNEELDDAILLSDSSETLHTNTTQEEDNTINNSSSNPAAVTHFCFLVHGHRGHSRDLSATFRPSCGAAPRLRSRMLVCWSCTRSRATKNRRTTESRRGASAWWTKC